MLTLRYGLQTGMTGTTGTANRPVLDTVLQATRISCQLKAQAVELLRVCIFAVMRCMHTAYQFCEDVLINDQAQRRSIQ